jgi:cholesterol oxidase
MEHEYDWIVIGSGFGGSVAALRLAEKGYRVLVLESGSRFADEDFAESTWDSKRYFFAPRLGMRGILRLTLFRDIFIASGAGVGGGSLGYANTLYRARRAFFEDPAWAADGWEEELAPHYDTAERMLGVTDVAFESVNDSLLAEMSEAFGVADTYRHTRVGVFFGEPGVEVPDPYFGGEGPRRTGCRHCGSCMVGCRHGAKNTLVKNYLFFAERLGVQVQADSEATDVRPREASDGSQGYVVTVERSGAWLRRRGRRQITARGVVFAAGALGTNKLLANCRHAGSLPRLSAQLGERVRTNSESILAMTAPEGTYDFTQTVAISSSIYPDPDTHIELVTYGEGADSMALLNTILVGDGTQFAKTFAIAGTSKRSLTILVMQTTDAAIRFRAVPRKLGRGVKLTTEQDTENPNPTFMPIANRAAEWLAQRTGGQAKSGIMEALFNIPSTAHILGGATVGPDPASGVIDRDGHVYGYENLLVTDGSALPANPGVNPSLTITALAERTMSQLPPAP